MPLYFTITKQNGGVLEYVSLGTGRGRIDKDGYIVLELGQPPYTDQLRGRVVNDEMQGRFTTSTGTVVSHGTFKVHRATAREIEELHRNRTPMGLWRTPPDEAIARKGSAPPKSPVKPAPGSGGSAPPANV